MEAKPCIGWAVRAPSKRIVSTRNRHPVTVTFSRYEWDRDRYSSHMRPHNTEEDEDNERYATVTIRAVFLSYIVVLIVFAAAWVR